MIRKILIILYLCSIILYPQTYLIKEKVGDIWVTSQASETNETQSSEKISSNPKSPIIIFDNVVNSEEIERMGYKNAQEVIANQPGFINKGTYMGNEVVESAAGNADNIKIYVNGILMNTAKGNADAGVDLRRIPANLIEKVEIKGNSIYITTKAPEKDILLVSLSYGKYNTINPSILFSRKIDDKQSFTFTADSFYSDANYYYDFENLVNDNIVGHLSNNNQLLINSSMEYRYKVNEKDYISSFVNISFSDAAAKYQLPPYDKTDSWFQFLTVLSSVSYNGFSDILNYKVTTSYVYDSFKDKPYFDEGRPISHYKSHAISLNTELNRFDELLEDTITMNNTIIPEYKYEFLEEGDEGIEDNFKKNPQRHSISIFYEPQLSFGYWDNQTPIFTLIPNIKYEYNYEEYNDKKNNNYLAYQGAFNLNVYKGYSIYFAYIHDYTAPTFNDLFYNDYGNPNLKPEISDQLQAKISISPITNLSLTSSYTYSMYTNKILWYGMSPTNADIAKAHIITTGISYDIPIKQKHIIKTKINYAYQLAYIGQEKLPKIGLPEDVIRVLLGYDFLANTKILSSISFNINYSYSTPRPLSTNRPIYYSTEFHDLGISLYSIFFDHLIFSTHFKNILNKTPILSLYSMAKPFTWDFEVGYNF